MRENWASSRSMGFFPAVAVPNLPLCIQVYYQTLED